MVGRRRLLLGLIFLEVLSTAIILGLVIFLLRNDRGLDSAENRPEAIPVEGSGAQTLESSPAAQAAVPGQVTVSPALSATMAAGPSKMVTPTTAMEVQPFIHVVRSGETLSVIASIYDVTVAAILEQNPWIANPDRIQPGDQVLIPGLGVEPAAPGLSAEGDLKPYSALPSLITSDLNQLSASYPLLAYAADGRLALHYQPGAFVDQNETEVQQILTDAYQFVENALGPSFEETLDLYLAGSLFQNQENLRGYTQSGLFRTFLLVDGTGSLGEQAYLFAHEFTHIFAFHHWGHYHSPMIHEGLATYLPQQFLEERTDYLSLDQICASIKAAGRMVPMTALAGQGSYGPPYFEGHIRSFLYYNQSACFVKYLVSVYGLPAFAEVYHSGDYSGVFDQSLAELDQQFQASLDRIQWSTDPFRFVATVETVAAAYDDYFDRIAPGRHANFQAYLTLDKARLAVNVGDLDQADQLLFTYYQRVEE